MFDANDSKHSYKNMKKLKKKPANKLNFHNSKGKRIHQKHTSAKIPTSLTQKGRVKENSNTLQNFKIKLKLK